MGSRYAVISKTPKSSVYIWSIATKRKLSANQAQILSLSHAYATLTFGSATKPDLQTVPSYFRPVLARTIAYEASFRTPVTADSQDAHSIRC